MHEVTGEQVNRVMPKIMQILEDETTLNDHQQCIVLAIVIISISKINGMSKDELVEGFESFVDDTYDDIQFSPLS